MMHPLTRTTNFRHFRNLPQVKKVKHTCLKSPPRQVIEVIVVVTCGSSRLTNMTRNSTMKADSFSDIMMNHDESLCLGNC